MHCHGNSYGHSCTTDDNHYNATITFKYVILHVALNFQCCISVARNYHWTSFPRCEVWALAGTFRLLFDWGVSLEFHQAQVYDDVSVMQFCFILHKFISQQEYFRSRAFCLSNFVNFPVL